MPLVLSASSSEGFDVTLLLAAAGSALAGRSQGESVTAQVTPRLGYVRSIKAAG